MNNMAFEEAIKLAKQAAEDQRGIAFLESVRGQAEISDKCIKCAEEYEQFAEWLEKQQDKCDGCKYEEKSSEGYPCVECSNCYTSKWECTSAKTRQSEFLKVYPNANVLGIQPCVIDKENSGKYCSKYDWCSECADDYWSQEVE